MSDEDHGRAAPPEPSLDVVVPRAPTEDGKGVHVVRLRPDAVELAELRPLEEGRPVAPSAEVVRLSAREDVPAWNVEVMIPRRDRPAAALAPGRSGPPQVATAAYRAHWDETFGDPDDDLN